jgi:uncharacterized protein
MLINLSDVLSHEDKEKHLDAEITMNSFRTQLGEFSIVEKTPLRLTITNMGKKVIRINGHADFVLAIPCSRCLEDVNTQISVEIDRELDMKLSESERIEKLDENNYLTGYNLDVDNLIYNEILVNWPMRVLCGEDCKGICNRCGTNQNLNHCDCDENDLDPRMAVISDIFSKFKEV